MRKCNFCNKNTKTEEPYWRKGKQVMRTICINPKCKSYTPFWSFKF